MKNDQIEKVFNRCYDDWDEVVSGKCFGRTLFERRVTEYKISNQFIVAILD